MATEQGVGERIGRVLAGDRAAASWLYETFATRLLRRLLRRYPHLGVELAEDVLHDAFVLFFRADNRTLTRFLRELPAVEQTEAELERRLWDLACGLVANRRRAGSGLHLLPLDESFGEEGSGAELAETVVIHRDTLARLMRCLEGARERVRLYLALRYQDGLTPEEIAHTTGWSAKTTYKLKDALNQAVKECAQKLGLSVG